MKLYTFDEINDRLRKETNTEQENELTEYLMMEIVNDAIDDAEAIIQDLHMDYFKTRANIAVTEGDTSLTVPTDIYGMRFKGIWFDDGTKAYKLTRITDELIPDVVASDDYRYYLTNDLGTGWKIHIYPDIRETSSTNFSMVYIRNAKRITETSDVIDIGECINYIKSHCRLSILRFFPNPVLMSYETNNFAKQESRLVSVMQTLAEDGEDTEMMMDASLYLEHE